VATYDKIADWYEREFLAALADTDPLGIRRALDELLGAGSGTCLEIGCGTGAYAAQVRELGWTPVGVDLSAGMLRHARADCRSPAPTPSGCRSGTRPYPPLSP
jgi:predicted TPR repeat methyltransferase